ncbi:replication initiation factor domain-containing protein, partial [Sellimonas catena]|uniref:replication initiation factor domain-containing protein n=1 Tax=Sellimonas catena TaxID=2994035 RepID=UPI002493563A
SFTACTLYSWSYLRATLNASLFSWFYYEILENKLSTFFIPHHNLRFVVPNRNESNKSRWKTCRFWERFLGAVEVLKLQVPKLHNSLEETQQWLTEGGVISAVKSFYFLEEHDALGGLEKVGTMLDKARYSNSLSSKLTAHLQRIDRTDLIPYIQYDTKHGKGGI